MEGSVRFVLAIVLLMLSYNIGGNAMNIASCISQDGCSCQLSESAPGASSNFSFKTHSLGCDRSSQSSSISDVELGFKSVAETSSNNYRLRKIIESSDFSKDIMYKFFLLGENSLVLDQNKSYYPDKDPHYSIICSNCYVFVLRHIFI